MSDVRRSPRLFPLALLLILIVAALIPASSTAAPAQVNVAGSFEESLGGANWSNNDPLTDMSDANGDGVWKFSANLPIADTYEYKIVEDANWDLAYPSANVPFTVATAGDEVRWYYDENDHTVADSTNWVIASVAGNFAAAIGGVDWAPDHLMTWLKDPDGDGVYVYQAQGVPEGAYEYKVALNESWDVSFPASNKPFSVPVGGSDVTFYYDSATNEVWEVVGEEPPGLLVTFPGNYPAAAGLGSDWDPANLNTQASDDNGDGVWKFVADAIPAGSYEFKATVGGTWDENYGLNGVPGGANVPFTADGGAVHFYYDRSDNYVASRPDFVIAAAVGSFQGAIGCPGDWQPDCLRGWLKDPDGDGVYSFATNEIPAGDYEAKVAHNESWDENYGAGGAPGGDNIPFSVSEGATVIFEYELSSHILTISFSGLEPGDEELVREPVRVAAADDFFYFVLPDRFENGDSGNDSGGDASGDPLVNGFLPTDKGYYHGGDLAGLMAKLDYLDGLGVTAIWMTPQFTNSWVQGDGTIAGSSAAYHGYWQIDYTQIDPHFGTNQEMKDFIDAAHGRGMKVFFDVVINHTGDVISYDEGVYSYRNKDDYPYRDAAGDIFDDRDYAGTANFPTLDPAVSFPYTPVFPTPADATAKNPTWLNDPIYYHNRGDSTFVGESSLYGDFFGLDDLFTEHPDVAAGLIVIHKDMITEFGVDGFRVDTVKHVNDELWAQFVPEILAHAQSQGIADFFLFGEVFDGDPVFTSRYTTQLPFPSVLDFGFDGAAKAFAVDGQATIGLEQFFAADDYFTDADSNAYGLVKFVGNHDIGRLGYAIDGSNPGATDAERVARSQLAYGLAFFSRGAPVIYYGDEQGFTGAAGDKDARQDMMPSLVADYNDDDLIGTAATTADANFDTTHPLYQTYQEFAQLRAAHPALRQGAQIHRYSEGSAGIYAFSRVERGEQVEYVVALNNSEAADTATFATASPSTTFVELYPGTGAIASSVDGQLTVTLPGLGLAVYRAEQPIPASSSAPGIAISTPAADSGVSGRVEVAAGVQADGLAEVTFAVSVDGATYQVIGTDDNAPYRVFYDVSDLAVGTPLTFKAIVSDLAGNLNADKVSVVVGTEEPPAAAAPYAVIHYYREDGDYGDHTTGDFNDYWGLHLWEDIDEIIEWTNPKPFLGEDEYGRFAWVKLTPGASNVGFIVHRGDAKDGTTADRFFNPSITPEIWLRQDDPAAYTSQAEAQGYVTIRYHRDDGDYGTPSADYNTFWGLHLWGDAIADGVGTDWTSPRPFDGVDDYGAYWNVPIKAVDVPVNFIIHRGDAKDPGPDQSMIPFEDATIWIQSGDEAIYPSRGAAENTAVLRYHRADGDYGDYASTDFNDFWGMHVWEGAASPNPAWQEPVKPVGFDIFGPIFNVPLTDGATQLAYILHRGDLKDPGPDQFLVLDEFGHEVWQLEGAGPDAEKPHYVLPILATAGANPGNINQQGAYWVAEDTIAWAAADSSANDYTLHYAPDGGLEATEAGITGGSFLELTRDPAGLPQAVTDKFPHLADLPALKIAAGDLALVPNILKGQIAVSAVSGGGQSVDATGLQIPGVLDDLYTYDGPLGVVWDGETPTLKVWAPTAKSVTFQLFDDADPATTSATMAMDLDPDTGVWTVQGDAGWQGKYYLYEVAVYVHSTGQVEHNVVTDPYSLSLAMNSSRSQIVDLADLALAPAGWQTLEKPPLAAPEDISIYEIHVRDFSVNDPLVPEELKGTFKAFTLDDSYGMRHLQALTDAGLTHLHLLPVFDIATIDEDKSNWQEPDPAVLATYPPDSDQQQAAVTATRDLDGFNWGYDPYHYTTPEGSYSTDPNGPARIVEFREMVQSLNEHGLRVVMDVVYNHTNASGQNEKSVLDRVVPGYYHRLDDTGQVETSTCCQNTASEHNMMEKLMIDSLVTWAREYKVDAFRFDLMGHHMVSNMHNVRAALDALTLEKDGVDGKSIYLYGEGWNFGEVADNARGMNATQLNLGGAGIGTFSDRLRDAVRGGGPFDSGLDLIRRQGFANGLYYDPNDLNVGAQDELDTLLLASDQIRVGMAGNLAGYQFVDRNGNLVAGANVDYNGQPAGYTADPQEDITYISKHDNQTLYDNNAYKIPLGTSMADRVRVQNVGLSTVLLGQGVPFMHAGSDLLRSKSLDRDSYNSGDWFNRLDFTYQANNFGVGLPVAGVNQDNWPIMGPLLADPELMPAPANIVQMADLFQELLQIRYSSPLFRLQTAEEVQARVAFHNTGPDQIPGLIVMTLSDMVEPDLDPELEQIIVLINANDEDQSFAVAELSGAYVELHPVQQNSVDPLVRTSGFDQATGMFSVPGRTAAVFVEYASPQERLGLLVDDVEDLVAAGILNQGQGNALIVKLQGALEQLDKGKPKVAINRLGAFVNEVYSLVDDGVLSPAEGHYLVGKAESIIMQIEALY